MIYYFVYSGNVYSTPFSDSGIDFMDGAEKVYAAPNQPERLARLLQEHSAYCDMLDDYEQIYNLREYCIRKIYSLSYRIGKILDL